MMKSKPTIKDAVLAIDSTANYSIESENIETLEFLNGTTPISDTDIETKLAELTVQWNAEKPLRDRQVSYPIIKDQLDKIYHEGLDAWKADIKAVKDKYPKE